MTYLSNLLAQIVAQVPTDPNATPTPAPTGTGPGSSQILIYVAIVMVIMWLIVFRPRKQEQKQRDQMLGGMKKHDKVLTIGGAIGTVMEVRDDEVILKVDDNTNTRMRFTRGAIQKILTSADQEKDKDAK